MVKSLYKIFLPLVLLVACNSESKKETRKVVPSFVPERYNEILLVYTKEIPKKYIDTTQKHLQKAFGLEVKLLASPALPQTLRSTVHRDRYRADSILQYLRKTYTGKALKVILLTHHDISTTKYSKAVPKKIKEPEYRYKDWAIFGLGSCPGYCCVVSVKRLWARQASEKTFLQRMKNIAVHELGHTFGLPHCPIPKCVMNDANETIRTVDRSTGTFCANCRRQI